jgi:serine protein kinase
MKRRPNKLLDHLLSDVSKSFHDDRTIVSFPEYFSMVVEKPARHLRSSAQYLLEMFDHFGHYERDLPTGKIDRFRIFDTLFQDGAGAVSGQEHVGQQLYRLIANFAREGRVNKLILMHGPNGSAKSSIVRALMDGMEHYAQQPEGAIYTFNWIFPSDRIGQDKIGFGGKNTSPAAGGSFAYIDAEHIDARLQAGMHDHPLFLLPSNQRLQFFRELFPDPGIFRDCVPAYLLYGDLSQKSRAIFNALLASYDGDVTRVLNHIQVERLYLSRRYRCGVATIEAQMAVDARFQQITADRSLSSLPRALQHLNLFEPTGPLADANRGLLEFSDLLKRPVDAFKYLLGTIETNTVSMDSFLMHLDMVLIASTNETYLDAFKKHPDFPSFKGRIELIKVPYLRRLSDERAIYESQITPQIVGKHIAPHAIKVAALWAVFTRMRKARSDRYTDEIKDVVESLSPSEKMALYESGAMPERLTTRQSAELKHILPELYEETLNSPLYEGRFGASAREIRAALLNAAHHPNYTYLSAIAVLEEIQDILEHTTVFEYLQQTKDAGYYDHHLFLQHTQSAYLDWIEDEIRDSMGLARETSYAEIFKTYVTHVTHWVKKEKLQDPATGDFIRPNMAFMEETEAAFLKSDEGNEDFRRSLIATIGAKSLEAPDGKPDFEKIFRSYVLRLKENFYAQRGEELRRLKESFLRYTGEPSGHGLDKEQAEQCQKMLECMINRYGYEKESARDAVAFLVKHRYVDDSSDDSKNQEK